MPSAVGASYVKLTAPLKNLYAQIEISDKALRASANDSGAFVNLLNAEMDNLIESSKFNMRRMIYGDGSTSMGEVLDYTLNSPTYKVENIERYIVGMRVNGTIDALTVTNMNDLDVLDVDYVNSKITVESRGVLTSDVEDDEVFEICLTNNYHPITGIGKHFSAKNGTIFGIAGRK